MLIPEVGVHQISERYFFTPSSLARELFYYPTRCGHYFCSHNYSFSHQSEIAMQGDHNQNIMIFAVQAGAFELEFAHHKTALAASGQIVLFDCREPYRYTASDGAEFTWLLLGGLNSHAFCRRILQSRGLRHVFTPPSYAEIVRLLGSLVSDCASGERPSESACSRLIHTLLCLLLVEETPVQDENDPITRAIRYMNRNLCEQISVQTVAEAVNLSPSYFSRQFKSRTGYSPYEYIVLRRIDRAKHMLSSTQLSVKEIAYATGYNSEEHFIHSFQKNVGIPPGMFRKYPI